VRIARDPRPNPDGSGLPSARAHRIPWGMSEFHRHVQRVLAAVCALCVGILLARAAGF
jgi:hypothetical protein